MRGKLFLDLSIGIDETNKFQLKRFVGVRVGVAYLRIKLVLRSSLRNLSLKSQFSIFDIFRDIPVHTDDFLKFVAVCGR